MKRPSFLSTWDFRVLMPREALWPISSAYSKTHRYNKSARMHCAALLAYLSGRMLAVNAQQPIRHIGSKNQLHWWRMLLLKRLLVDTAKLKSVSHSSYLSLSLYQPNNTGLDQHSKNVTVCPPKSPTLLASAGSRAVDQSNVVYNRLVLRCVIAVFFWCSWLEMQCLKISVINCATVTVVKENNLSNVPHWSHVCLAS